MNNVFKLVSLPTDDRVELYGAELGDFVELDSSKFKTHTNVWCLKGSAFKEPGWGGIATFCVADDMESFLECFEEVK